MKSYIRQLAALCMAGVLAVTAAGCTREGPDLPEAPTEVVPASESVTTAAQSVDSETIQTTIAESEAGEVSEEGGQTVSTVVYYQDGSGYLVPVMREIPYTEGIAKAALMKLVESEEDQQALAARGVRAPIPEGSSVDLDIQEGTATVDVQLSCQLDSGQDEGCVLGAVVNTLMEFDTVDQVQVMINGQKIKKMPRGTEIEEVYRKPLENMDPMGMPSSSNAQTQLYFTNTTGAFLVPVKRVTTGEITALTAAQAMIDPGPTGELVSLLPPNCRILDVNVDQSGTATVDFSEEFLALSALPASEQLALRGLNLTLSAIDGVKKVAITVEGEPYEPVAATMGSGTAKDNYLNTMP